MSTTNIDLDCTLCVLDAGFQPPCNPDSTGGNDAEIYIISTCNIESFEEAYDNNLITAITLDGATFWYKLQANPDSVTVEEVLNSQGGGWRYNINIQTAVLADASTNEEGAALARDFIEKISNPYEKFSLVINANAGDVRYLYGASKRGLRIADGTQYTSGANDEELATFTLVFGGSGSLAKPLDSSVTLPLS